MINMNIQERGPTITLSKLIPNSHKRVIIITQIYALSDRTPVIKYADYLSNIK